MAKLAESVEDAGALDGEDLGGGALGENLAFFEADDVRVEQKDLFDVVGDGEDWNFVEGGPAAHGGEEIVAEGAADAGEGLVEEHKLLIWNGESAGQVDALLFATGEVAGKAVGEVFEVEEAEDVLLGWCGFVVGLLGEGDVGGDRKVWEERGLLGGVGDLAVAGREVGEILWISLWIEAREVGVVEEAGEGAEDGRFAASGRAVNDCPRGS